VAAKRLNAHELSPLERAALQNAALWVASLSSWSEKDPRVSAIQRSARALIKKLALTQGEIAHLPAAAETASRWLGDGATWKRGVETRRLHSASDAHARSHLQLQRGDTLADLVRLILVSESGAPFAADVAQRIAIRRTEPDGVHLCVAELDPMSARCGVPGSLRPLAPARQANLLSATNGGAPCSGCHANNHPNSAPFGPDTGFQMSESSAARVKTSLQRALF
jgi:hypothetical protein